LYPCDMGEVFASLRALGMKTVLTVDPLAVQVREEWAVKAADGQRWLNPMAPEAHAYGVKRLAKVVRLGADCLGVRASLIPDAVLRQFNMTREQAHGAAMAMACEAAPGRAFTLTEQALAYDTVPWERLNEMSACLGEFRVHAAPLVIQVDTIDDVPAPMAQGLHALAAPLVLQGVPSAAARRRMAKALRNTSGE
jgi:hypothetical protein